jgi:pSer/pThr/pTyr-binding forkhead associated (FHA) protein
MEVTLTVAQGRTRVRRIRLRSAETIVGRQKGCDVRIPAPEVSRRHCLLSYADGELSVEDLDSSNGTYINQVRVYGRTSVRAGDRLQIGPVTFIVDYPMSPKSSGLPDAAAGSGATKEAAARPARKGQDDLPIPLADEPSIPPKKQRAAPPPEPAADVIPFQDQSVPEEAAPVEFDESEPLRLPEGENFRDFLSRMEE